MSVFCLFCFEVQRISIRGMGEVEGVCVWWGGGGGGRGIPQHLNKTVGAYSKVTTHSHRVGRGGKGGSFQRQRWGYF